MSHPMRVRGLKPGKCDKGYFGAGSHPMRVRGLKPSLVEVQPEQPSRTPCGCVD